MTIELETSVTGAPPVGISAWLGRIVCGDNTEVLSGFPDACIDLVVTSPPYDDLRTYGGHSWNFESLAAQLVRVLKPGGVIVWVVADATVNGSETLTSMRQAIHFKDVCGLNVHDTMVYAKKNPMPKNDRRCTPAWEYVFVLSRGLPARWNPPMDKTVEPGKLYRTSRQFGVGGELKEKWGNGNPTGETKVRRNVWEYATGGHLEDKTPHAAQMPEQLAKDCVSTWSNPGDVVLDPFAGSGTTCKAAKELNRQWCGIEINPEYCAIAEARLSQDVLQLETCAMRPNKD